MLAACASSHSHTRSPNRAHHPVVDKKLRVIDISHQQLFSLPAVVIENRLTVEHLIADGNLLNENSLHIPRFPRLLTLSINNNKIRNVGLLLQHLQEACPSLEFLSLIGNPGWPHPIQNSDIHTYKTHRLLTARALPRLKNLDCAELRRPSRASICSSASSSRTPSPPSTPEISPPSSPLPLPEPRKPRFTYRLRTISYRSSHGLSDSD